jgi:hypothetical protein
MESSAKKLSLQPVVADAVPMLQLLVQSIPQRFGQQQLLQNQSVPDDKPSLLLNSLAIDAGTDNVHACCADTGPCLSPAAALVYHSQPQACKKAADELVVKLETTTNPSIVQVRAHTRATCTSWHVYI